MTIKLSVNFSIYVTLVLWTSVNCVLQFHTHIHRQFIPSDMKMDFRRLKGNIKVNHIPSADNTKVNNIPSAGDGALNPWFYRFPPWTDHNPPPPSLALTNGEALKNSNMREDLSILRKAPYEEDRFVFHDVKVDLDLPYVAEVVKTILANQDRDDDHLVYGEDDNSHHTFSEKDGLSNIHPQNGLFQTFDDSLLSSGNPSKAKLIDRSSPDIVFLKTNDVFPLYEVYSKSSLNSKFLDSLESHSFPKTRSQSSLQQDSIILDNSEDPSRVFQDNAIDSPQIVFPENNVNEKNTEKVKKSKLLPKLGVTPRGLNSRLSSSTKDGPKYPTSIQDIINEQKPGYLKKSSSQDDPGQNKPSQLARQNRSSEFLGSKWIWSDEHKR